jgi:hypothetical protein
VKSLYPLSVVAALLASTPAAAGRAVGPFDRLPAWTLVLGSARRTWTASSLGHLARREVLGGSLAMTLAAGLADWLDVGLRQPIAPDRSAARRSDDGRAERCTTSSWLVGGGRGASGGSSSWSSSGG